MTVSFLCLVSASNTPSNQKEVKAQQARTKHSINISMEEKSLNLYTRTEKVEKWLTPLIDTPRYT